MRAGYDSREKNDRETLCQKAEKGMLKVTIFSAVSCYISSIADNANAIIAKQVPLDD
jgi:hypothetical protein